MFGRIVASSLMLLLAAGLAAAQQRGQTPTPAPTPASSGFSVTGQILTDSTRDEGRRPVYLEHNRQRVDTVFTDTLGRFEFRDVMPGNYEIVVSLDGYEDERQRVDFLPGFGAATVLIFLRRKEPESAAPREAAGVVDVTELDRNIARKAVQEFEKAAEETARGNTAKAAERLQAALKIAPDFYRAHAALGRAYQSLKRYQDAEREYLSARTLNPRAAQPLLSLGDLYIQEAAARTQEGPEVVAALLNQALTVLQDATQLEPGSLMAHYLYGTASYKSAHYEEAEAHLKRALEIDPQMSAARVMLANLYVRLERWDAALVQLDAYLSENPKAANRSEIEQARAKVEANRNRIRN